MKDEGAEQRLGEEEGTMKSARRLENHSGKCPSTGQFASPWRVGLLWAWWPIQLGGRSSAQGKPAIKLTSEVRFGMNHTEHFSFQLVFCVSINKGGNKSNVQKKNSRKNFVPIAMTAPSFKSHWTQPDHFASTGCKSNAQGWQSVYWKGSGTTFSQETPAADGPCRVGSLLLAVTC